MTDALNPHWTAWESFYVIVGSSGAALIGLQFVVITLIAGMRKRPSAETISAFATPTVVHLAGALLVSAVMSAPWPSLGSRSAALAVCGLGGLAYGRLVLRRTRRQTDYRPVREDWLWYTILPSGIYAALTLTALFLSAMPRVGPFAIGGAALGLLLIAIRNAWDTLIHTVITPSAGDAPPSELPPGNA